VATRTKTRTKTARQVSLQHLSLAAGQAFGFEEIDREGPSSFRSQMVRFGTVASTVICLVAAAAMYTGL
jgi:hypothetical protein